MCQPHNKQLQRTVNGIAATPRALHFIMRARRAHAAARGR